MIEPVDPFKPREFYRFEVSPRAGPANDLGLAQALGAAARYLLDASVTVMHEAAVLVHLVLPHPSWWGQLIQANPGRRSGVSIRTPAVLPKSKVRIAVEISEGADDDVRRVADETCRMLKFKSQKFGKP